MEIFVVVVLKITVVGLPELPHDPGSSFSYNHVKKKKASLKLLFAFQGESIHTNRALYKKGK